MLRVLFDTNIYGHLAEEQDWREIERKIKDDKNFIVYGIPVIRKEIRDIPTDNQVSRRARILLLDLYDSITGKHFLPDSIKITNLALKYYGEYRNLGGIYNWKTSIQVDFIIVACASFHGLDVVYSGDLNTLSGTSAKKAYSQVNIKESLRTPDFFTYKELLQKFRSYSKG